MHRARRQHFALQEGKLAKWCFAQFRLLLHTSDLAQEPHLWIEPLVFLFFLSHLCRALTLFILSSGLSACRCPNFLEGFWKKDYDTLLLRVEYSVRGHIPQIWLSLNPSQEIFVTWVFGLPVITSPNSSVAIIKLYIKVIRSIYINDYFFIIHISVAW